MAYDYSSLKATADRLIARFGKTATLVTRTKSGTDYNPTITDSPASVTVVELNYSLTNRDGSLIQQGDKMFLMKAAAAPDMESKIRLGSTDYMMVDVKEIAPGATTLLFEVQARA